MDRFWQIRFEFHVKQFSCKGRARMCANSGACSKRNSAKAQPAMPREGAARKRKSPASEPPCLTRNHAPRDKSAPPTANAAQTANIAPSRPIVVLMGLGNFGSPKAPPFVKGPSQTPTEPSPQYFRHYVFRFPAHMALLGAKVSCHINQAVMPQTHMKRRDLLPGGAPRRPWAIQVRRSLSTFCKNARSAKTGL